MNIRTHFEAPAATALGSFNFAAVSTRHKKSSQTNVILSGMRHIPVCLISVDAHRIYHLFSFSVPVSTAGAVAAAACHGVIEGV